MTKPDSAPRFPVTFSTAPVAGALVARMGPARQADAVEGVDARKQALRARQRADGSSDAPSADEASPVDEAPQDMPAAEETVPPADTSDQRDDDAAAVVPASGSTEKSFAAMVAWLVGASLAVGSKIFLSESADRDRPDPSLPAQPDPLPKPQPKPDTQPEPGPKPQPQPQPKPEPPLEPKPEPAQAPDAPILSLHSPGATADGLLGARGEIRVDGLTSGARWEYSLDKGKTWNQGVGASLAPTLFGEDGGHSLQVVQVDVAGRRSEASGLDFVLDTTAEAPTASVRSGARDHFPANRDDGSDFYPANRVNAHGWLQVDVEAGATWTYRIDGGSELTGSDGRIDLAGLSDGVHELRIRQLDLAGNLSGEQVIQVAVDNVAPVASGRWTAKPGEPNFGWTMHADEAVQFVAIPVGTANDGTAQSYLENGRASLRPLVSDGTDGWTWFEGANEMYVILAIDTAGNASFVQTRGSATPDALSVSAVEGRRGMTPPDLNIDTATFDTGLQAWVARATIDKTDHLYGTSHADRFDFGPMPGASSGTQIDWIHGYNRQQGDVIQLNDRDLQSLPVGATAGDLARYFRKEILTDGTISLWIDVDGAGRTSPADFDHRILVSAEQGTDLTIHLANGGTFVL